jgi:uncharacterized protein (TIGR02145 family)
MIKRMTVTQAALLLAALLYAVPVLYRSCIKIIKPADERGEVCCDCGESLETAEAYFDRGNKCYSLIDPAIADYTEAIRLDSVFVPAYINRGNLYYGTRRYDKAIADYAKAIQLDSHYVKVHSKDGVSQYAKAYNGRGDMHHLHGNYDSAIVDYTEAIRINPNYVEAYHDRGATYFNKKDYDRAITDFTEAIRISPDYAELYNVRGAAYRKKGDYAQAIANFNEAIRLSPADYKVYFNRGLMYADKDDYDQAIADYTEAILLRPSYAEAYGVRGAAYHEKGDYERAINDYNESLRLNPNNERVYGVRGGAYMKKKEYDKAIVDFEAALRIKPDYEEVKKNLEEAEKFLAEGAAAAAVAETFESNDKSAPASVSPFTDSRDGKIYKAIKVGKRVWMAENLNYAASGSACYKDKADNCAKYGRLYDWNTAMAACPAGTHLPGDAEWQILVDYAGGEKTAGTKLKSSKGWKSYKGVPTGTNDYSFSALPGGLGADGGYFNYAGNIGFWWSTTDNTPAHAWFRHVNSNYEDVNRDYNDKTNLFSVRCVLDDGKEKRK